MNFVGTKVTHHTMGEGAIVGFEAEDTRVIVRFQTREVKFAYPDFFLNCFDMPDELRKVAENVSAERNLKTQQEKEAREIQREFERAQRERLREKQLTPRQKKERAFESKNIVFKCRYCDGGKTDSRVGFDGLCSEENRSYNLSVRKTGFCGSDNCLCKQYRNGDISLKDLCTKYENDHASVCYEANLFHEWVYKAGIGESGKKNTIRADLRNKLCVLTTALPNAKSKERYIFGVFIVDECDEGDDVREGMVRAHPKYRVELTATEMKQVCFWDFYRNKSDKAPYQWGTSLFRYIGDDAAKSILKKIKEVKTNPAVQALLDEMITII